jgi:hypothetical protein
MTTVIRFGLVLLFLSAPLFAQDLGVTPATCPAGIQSIADCPERGCGGVSDAFLNLAKNRTDTPTPAELQDMSVKQVKHIRQPRTWKTGKNRDSLRVPGREGTPVRLVGFLKIVKPGSKESCNCELDTVADTDVHLVIVNKLKDSEKRSVTAEITPRVRAARHTNWVPDQVSPLQNKLVRLTGWLMLDTAHLRHPVLLPGEGPRNPLKRATNWEVHPIMKFEVCNADIQMCRAGQGWQEF